MRITTPCLCVAALLSLSGCKTESALRQDVQAHCTHASEAVVKYEPDMATRELAVDRLTRRCMADAGYGD